MSKTDQSDAMVRSMGYSTVVPALRYQNAQAAIEWLCSALGFERQLVIPGADGAIAHAQLTLGAGMVMLSSQTMEGPHSEIMCQPESVAHRETQFPCLFVADCDALYDRVRALDGEIIVELADMEYGGRAFTCRDPEGHLWNVGTYNPWSAPRNTRSI